MEILAHTQLTPLHEPNPVISNLTDIKELSTTQNLEESNETDSVSTKSTTKENSTSNDLRKILVYMGFQFEYINLGQKYVVITLSGKFNKDNDMLHDMQYNRGFELRHYRICGTSANLHQGEYYSIQDLLYGMMLPSGNDAAHILADTFGILLSYQKQEKLNEFFAENELYIDPETHKNLIKTYQKQFIHEMNTKAKFLKLSNTVFNNPHGLIDEKTRSCAQDLCKLVTAAMENTLFYQIVNTKTYKYTYLTPDLNIHTNQWVNTNKLLWKQFAGVKTGVTDTAGPCLASFYTDNNWKITIVTLNSLSLDHRWNEHEILLQWTQNL